MQNEETNQTLDYTNISKVDIPEDYNEGDLAAAEDEEPAAPRNELIILAGRLFRDESKEKPGDKVGKWVYEKWGKSTTSNEFPKLAQRLAKLYIENKTEEEEQTEKLSDLTRAKRDAFEEKKRQAALEAKKT